MPNTISAIQRAKRTKSQTAINRVRKSKYKSAVKQMSEYINLGDVNGAKKFIPKFYSQLMKVAKTGVISKKVASRKISRFTKKINNLKKK